MNVNTILPNRKTIRLQNFDYSSEGAYFITIVCQNRCRFFGEIKNEQMILNEYGKIAEEEWKNSVKIRTNISLGEFIVMPDHMHMILHIEKQSIPISENKLWTYSNPKSPSHTIGAIIRGFKGATTKKINLLLNSENGRIAIRSNGEFIKHKIWQRNYYEHIIRDEIAYQRIANYIKENPKNWNKK